MNQYGWANCPENVRIQIDHFLGAVRDLLGDNLVGVYLHGSLAMDCFNPDRSDIDILIVTKHGMTVDTKRDVAELLLRLSKDSSPIEISVLSEQDLDPWEYSTPFDFHYSETWREQYRKHLSSGEWKRWNEKQYKDPDLAAHITITLSRGLCLYGRPIKEVFPLVPKEDYIASILNDFEDARDGILENQIYGVLNLCRVYWYLLKGCICSKDEAGVWAADFLPEEFRTVVKQALEVYRGDQRDELFDGAALEKFAKYVDEQIKLLSGSR